VGEASQAVMSTKETSFPDSFFKENQYTSVVGMTAVKDAETYAELEMLNKSAFAHPIFYPINSVLLN
jgi:hypothetical protein